jgi:hypothetical protein
VQGQFEWINRVQGVRFSNLAEFPVLQMLYRQGMIIPGFIHGGNAVIVDLNFRPGTRYPSPYVLPLARARHDRFSVVHIGEGDGWNTLGGLSVCLNAPDDAIRDSLMPANRPGSTTGQRLPRVSRPSPTGLAGSWST